MYEKSIRKQQTQLAKYLQAQLKKHEKAITHACFDISSRRNYHTTVWRGLGMNETAFQTHSIPYRRSGRFKRPNGLFYHTADKQHALNGLQQALRRYETVAGSSLNTWRIKACKHTSLTRVRRIHEKSVWVFSGFLYPGPATSVIPRSDAESRRHPASIYNPSIIASKNTYPS